jgi:hypothetical protein
MTEREDKMWKGGFYPGLGPAMFLVVIEGSGPLLILSPYGHLL